jgi:hypothetical protein
MAPSLIPCPHCGCHAKSTETRCPSCGESFRRDGGSIPRAAVAALLGLTAAGALAGACSAPVAAYGPALTTGGSGTGNGGSGGSTTTASITFTTGTGGAPPADAGGDGG